MIKFPPIAERLRNDIKYKYKGFKNVGSLAPDGSMYHSDKQFADFFKCSEKSIKRAIDKVPDGQKEKYKNLLNADGIIERLIPTYSRYYTKVDLVNMINYYQSPTGQKVLESTPEIVKETVRISIEYIKEKSAP